MLFTASHAWLQHCFPRHRSSYSPTGLQSGLPICPVKNGTQRRNFVTKSHPGKMCVVVKLHITAHLGPVIVCVHHITTSRAPIMHNSQKNVDPVRSLLNWRGENMRMDKKKQEYHLRDKKQKQLPKEVKGKAQFICKRRKQWQRESKKKARDK